MNIPIQVIAITGLKRSGKDSLAKHVASKYFFKHVKVSAKLKEVVKTAFDLTDDHVESHLKDVELDSLKTTPRRLMDFIGTRVFQYELSRVVPEIGRQFWIEDLMRKNKGVPVVISDIRFHHELEYLRNHVPNCLVVRVVRKNETVDTSFVSESEVSSLKVDYQLYNFTSLESLYAQMDVLITSHRYDM